MNIEEFQKEQKKENFIREYNLIQDDLCYYDNISKTLKGSQITKAKAFNRNKCIQYQGNGMFICKPIKDYNSSVYSMKKEFKEWTCNCQWFMKNRITCSHLQALFLFFKIKAMSNDLTNTCIVQ